MLSRKIVINLNVWVEPDILGNNSGNHSWSTAFQINSKIGISLLFFKLFSDYSICFSHMSCHHLSESPCSQGWCHCSLLGVLYSFILEEEMATHSSILPGKSHGLRSLAGCSSWGSKESDMTEQACTLSCITPIYFFMMRPEWLVTKCKYEHINLFGKI